MKFTEYLVPLSEGAARAGVIFNCELRFMWSEIGGICFFSLPCFWLLAVSPSWNDKHSLYHISHFGPDILTEKSTASDSSIFSSWCAVQSNNQDTSMKLPVKTLICVTVCFSCLK